MKNKDLCKWLRDNSSGTYRPSAEAATRIEELESLIKEASDYLDTNTLTSIGSSSILHNKFKNALQAT